MTSNPLRLSVAFTYDEALDCVFKLFSLNLVKVEIERPDPNSNSDSNSNIVYKIVDLVCKSGGPWRGTNQARCALGSSLRGSISHYVDSW
ncbi:hypothetical protein CFP56_027335 [Quercus suber]|uniref:Uncharacterized protein n=1 Tax=Quercus suber TaxID=58331 RepID=A0AAW0LY58_QUESU